MKTKIVKFRAASAEAAMTQVHRSLGADALILEVKQEAAQGLFGWLSSRRDYVVKASRASAKAPVEAQPLDTETRVVVPSTTKTIAAAAAAASRRSQSAEFDSEGSAGAATTRANNVPVVPAALETPTTSRFQFDEATNDFPSVASMRISEPTASSMTDTSNGSLLSNNSTRPNAPLSSEIWRQAAVDAVRELTVPGELNRVAFHTEFDRDRSGISKIEQRLDTLQQMIADLGRKPQTRGLAELPPELFPHYLTLIEADVDDEIAHELILKLQRHATPGQLSDTSTSTALLTVLIEQQIACARSLVPRIGRRQIAMIVGPTGVGKTTTLAKLAGCYGVDRGLKLGLITVDTYRVAAVEQLRAYADIIDLPMRVVHGTDQVQDALDSLADRDLVLIDTAGRSPHDDRRLDELKQLVDATRPDHVYLILSLVSGAKALQSTADRFASVGPTSLVFTKLDEAAGCGGLLAAARGIGLPVSYLTTGQDVPLDIEPANSSRIARLILGLDRIATIPPIRT